MIIAIDPGLTTGYVIATSPTQLVEVGDVNPFDHVLEIIDMMRSRGDLELVICESFSLYSGKQNAQSFSNMPSSQAIGMLKHYCQTHNVELVMQGPVERKVITKDMLRAVGYWQALRGLHHAKDAAMHLLLYYTKQPKWQGKLWEIYSEKGLFSDGNESSVETK